MPAIKRLALALLVVLIAACASTGQQTTAPPPAADAMDKQEVTIALLGATGMVGGYVLDEALAQGYKLRVLARTPAKLDAYKNRITVIKGDATDPAAIEALLRGSDVVISALGPVKSDGDAAKFISTRVTTEIVRVMPVYGIQRYIVVSGGAVVMPGDDRNAMGWLIRQLVSLSLQSTLQDKQAEYQVLAGSSIQWTLVRGTLIDAEAFTQRPVVAMDTPPYWHLKAGELAQFVIEQIPSEQFLRQGPFLGSR